MTEETAALDDNMPPMDDVETEVEATPEVKAEEVTEESAPSTVEDSSEESKGSNKVQERINKITADKWAEKRRADELERKLAEMQTNTQAQPQVGAEPTLEQFDYDESAYRSAMVKHEVAKELEASRAKESERQVEESYSQTQAAFNARVAEQTKKTPDYAEVVSDLQLPDGIVNTLIEAENGPELAYHLAKHKDLADSMFNMSITQASMKLGQISAQLSAKPEIKTSAAPEPIEPVTASGSLNKSYDEMSMEEIYNS